MKRDLTRPSSLFRSLRRLLGVAITAGLMGGCTPIMLDDTPAEDHWQQATHWPLELPAPHADDRFMQLPAGDDQRLAAGDRLSVRVAGSELFDGSYEVDHDGRLRLPWLSPVEASNKTIDALADEITRRLVEEELIRPGLAHVSIRLEEWAPLAVAVSGAVFFPGEAVINTRLPEERMVRRDFAGGDASQQRRLSAALTTAGGIRPDADLSHIELIRDGQTQVLDMRGLIDGEYAANPWLRVGDRIHVPSSGAFQAALMRPSPLTAPGIVIYASNLTTPANNNNVSNYTVLRSQVPYGVRMLQGVINANCVGGIQATSGSRRAVLISTNPMTHQPVVVDRGIDALLANPADVGVNPYLMPEDVVGCYDSGVTNIRDIARTLTDLLTPATLL